MQAHLHHPLSRFTAEYTFRKVGPYRRWDSPGECSRRRWRRGSGQQWPRWECPTLWSAVRLAGWLCRTSPFLSKPAWRCRRGGRDQFSLVQKEKPKGISVPNPSKIPFFSCGTSTSWNEDSADRILIFHKQKVPFGVLAEDLNSLLCHLHYGGVPRAVPKHLKFHVFWLEQT